MKILDAYISVSPAKGLKLMAGQMRVPFSVSASRAPALYYFAKPSMYQPAPFQDREAFSWLMRTPSLPGRRDMKPISGLSPSEDV